MLYPRIPSYLPDSPYHRLKNKSAIIKPLLFFDALLTPPPQIDVFVEDMGASDIAAVRLFIGPASYHPTRVIPNRFELFTSKYKEKKLVTTVDAAV